MKKFGIIAGGGDLPLIISNNLKKNKFEVFIIGIKNNFKSNKFKGKFNFVEHKIGSLTKILNSLKKEKINQIIFAGSIKRPSYKDYSFDLKALQFLRQYNIDKLGDNNLLKSISNYFQQNGYKFIKWRKYCPELFIDNKSITTIKPSDIAYVNLKKSLEIFKYFGKSDVGQSIIAQNKMILGLEAAEGTDELIKRCTKYKRIGDKGILVKLMKYNQDERFDLPTIGIDTLKKLKKFNYEGIFIQKNFCIIINKNEVIKYANNNNLFIEGINKS